MPSISSTQDSLRFAEGILGAAKAAPIIERLKAIKFLETSPTSRGMELLSQAVYQTEQPDRNSIEWEDRHEPIGGVVAASAARALGALSAKGGLSYIAHIVNDSSAHPLVREAAVFGLAGVIDEDAYQILLVALDDEDPLLRAGAVFAVQETLRRARGEASETVKILVDGLAFMVLHFTATRDLPFEDPAVLARRLLKKYITPRTLDLLGNAVRSSGGLNKAKKAIGLLQEQNSCESRRVLAHSLKRFDLRPEVYIAIGEALRCSEEPLVKKIALEVVSERTFITSLLMPFRFRDKAKLYARHQAACTIQNL